jgi:hypothetical protein
MHLLPSVYLTHRDSRLGRFCGHGIRRFSRSIKTAKDPAANPIVLPGHEAAVFAVAISQDSRWVVPAATTRRRVCGYFKLTT